MTNSGAVTMIGLGLFALVFAIISDNFYPSMIGGGKKPIPKWFGRLWCLVFAAIMFYFGLAHLLRKH
jgi:hypothetical protein